MPSTSASRLRPPLGSSPQSRGPERLRPSRGRTLVSALLWVLFLGWVAFSTVTAGHTPARDVAVYSAALLVLAVCPGYTLARGLLPSPKTWLGMLGQTAGLGIVATIIEWAVSVGFRLPALAFVCALILTLLPLARRDARARLRFHPSASVNPISLGAMLLATGLQGQSFANNLYRSGLYPSVTHWYQDNWWHWSINAQLARKLVPQYPQVLGEPLSYHWLANAHMALMHNSTGISNDTILMRLWYWPMLIGAALIAVLVVERIAQRAWLGPLAGALIMCLPNLRPNDWMGIQGWQVWIPFSPSQTFAVPVLLFAVYLSILVLTRSPEARKEPALWGLLCVVFLIAPGAKSSNLPMIAAAALLVAVIALLCRAPRVYALRAAGLLLIAVAATVITAPLFTGAGDGTGIQLFSTVRRMRGWFGLVNIRPSISHSVILPGLDTPLHVFLFLLILTVILVSWGWILPGVAALSRRRSVAHDDGRTLSLWLMAGIGLAGFAASMLIDHDGLSQVYFLRGASGVLCCFAIAGLDVLLEQADQRRSAESASPSWRKFGILAVGAGLITGVVLVLIRRQNPQTVPVSNFLPLTLLQGGFAVLMAAAALVLLLRFRSGRRGSARVLAFLSVMAMLASSTATVPDLLDPQKLTYSEGFTVPKGPMLAALWVRQNTPEDAVVATNVHCHQLKPTKNCETRTFWVSGLTERQTYIEGWGYSSSAHRDHGKNGLIYAMQPFHDSVRFQENELAFTRGSVDDLAKLKSRGAQYLFAVRAAGPVSPDLKKNAELIYSQPGVDVYRLR